jgi:hypothetical protein
LIDGIIQDAFKCADAKEIAAGISFCHDVGGHYLDRAPIAAALKFIQQIDDEAGPVVEAADGLQDQRKREPRMSMNDTAGAANLDAVFERVQANSEPPLSGLYHAEAFERERTDEVNARQAADELIKRRNQEAPVDDEIRLQDTDGSRLDPKASLTQSDARQAAKHLADYRHDRDSLAAELRAADTQSAEPEQPSEEVAAQAQQRAVEEQARLMQLEHQKQAELERARQARAAYEQASRMMVNHAAELHNTEFPDIRTYADIAKLAVEDPARHARLMQLAQYNQTAAEQAQRLEKEAVQQQQAQWQNYAAAEDAAFAQSHPELNDPATFAQSQKDALAYLESQGITREQAAHLWNTNSFFRGAHTQKALYDAARWHAASLRAKDKLKNLKPVPPVHKPGESRGFAGRHDEDLRILNAQLNEHGRVRDAAKLLIQRRAAARG